MKKNFEELITEFTDFSLKIFSASTPKSSLKKLRKEIKEVEKCFDDGELRPEHDLTEEYVDCLMCIFDSARRAGVSLDDIIPAFSRKLKINQRRKWIKNPDNTYSHIKEL